VGSKQTQTNLQITEARNRFFLSSFLSEMSCAAAASNGSKGCAFAAEKLVLYESRASSYVRMKLATEKAVREGKLEIHIAGQDLALLDSKIREATGMMVGLKMCMAASR
jgi:hypothetical protein